MQTKGLGARLSRTLLLQVGFISIAAVLGVALANILLEDVLIRRALTDEAEHFWEKRGENPQFALPDTQNLTGYMEDVPSDLRLLQPGFHNLQESKTQGLVLVSERAGERLVLVFDGQQVDELAFYFGLLPLALVLLVLYLSTWLGFRASRRAFSPVIALAREVRQLDPQDPDSSAFEPDRLPEDPDEEVRVLADAMQRFVTRLNEFVRRERQFTRDASHELRSPLTVIGMASNLLEQDAGLSDKSRHSVARIKRAARDMEELIGAFLLLAREDESGLPSENLCVNTVVVQELERTRMIASEKPVESVINESCRLFVEAPEKVLAVMLGNLLRNAFSYTDAGKVTIEIGDRRVSIEDSGVGMHEEQVREMYRPFVRGDRKRRGGYGVGLTIVRRLSDRFGWPIDISSEVGVGTRVEIAFPDARVEPL